MTLIQNPTQAIITPRPRIREHQGVMEIAFFNPDGTPWTPESSGGSSDSSMPGGILLNTFYGQIDLDTLYNEPGFLQAGMQVWKLNQTNSNDNGLWRYSGSFWAKATATERSLWFNGVAFNVVDGELESEIEDKSLCFFIWESDSDLSWIAKSATYGTAASRDVGTEDDEVVIGADPRLSDPRIPASGSVMNDEVGVNANIDASKINRDTDGALAANSDDRIPSQKAIKTFTLAAVANAPLVGYGTGLDGDVVISSNTTITSDLVNGIKNYNNLTINSGVTLTVLGGWINVKNTFANNGTVLSAGQNASGATGGATAGPYGSILSNGGGAGNTGAGSAGLPTANPSNGMASIFGGAGGAGGNGSSGSGGVSGVVASLTSYTEAGNLSMMEGWASGQVWSRNSAQMGIVGAGRGGGGGSGDATNTGGGGGGGGGFLVIRARHITGTGTINANGGNGATRSTGNVGGGGGGGGGFVGIITGTITNPWTVTVNGGSGGSGVGTGTAGSAGSVGNIRFIGGAA